jgi:hypothetical protein
MLVLVVDIFVLRRLESQRCPRSLRHWPPMAPCVGRRRMHITSRRRCQLSGAAAGSESSGLSSPAERASCHSAAGTRALSSTAASASSSCVGVATGKRSTIWVTHTGSMANETSTALRWGWTDTHPPTHPNQRKLGRCDVAPGYEATAAPDRDTVAPGQQLPLSPPLLLRLRLPVVVPQPPPPCRARHLAVAAAAAADADVQVDAQPLARVHAGQPRAVREQAPARTRQQHRVECAAHTSQPARRGPPLAMRGLRMIQDWGLRIGD